MDPKNAEERLLKLTGFLIFVEERRQQMDAEAVMSKHHWNDVVGWLNTEWNEMGMETKLAYNEKADAKRREMEANKNVREAETVKMKETVKFMRKITTPPHLRFKDNAIKDKLLENKLICSLWSYPHGKDKVAIVIHMNLYSSHESVHIPGEIGLTAFSISGGILNDYWTLVDPGEPPIGEAGNFELGVAAAGLPMPPFSNQFSVNYMDYKRIVEDIETFVKTYVLSETKQPFLVCLKDSLKEVTKGLKWLYEKAGCEISEKDDHWINEMTSIEKLLIVMSMGGLENLAKLEGSQLKDVVSTIQSVSSAASLLSKSTYQSSYYTCLSGGSNKTVGFSSIPPGSYSFLGNVKRVASTLTQQPCIVMGAFLFEQQVTDYMKNLEYAHYESLACKYHNENASKEDGGKLIQCALSKAKRLVLLALDVMLINYGIKPMKGLHYPLEHE